MNVEKDISGHSLIQENAINSLNEMLDITNWDYKNLSRVRDLLALLITDIEIMKKIVLSIGLSLEHISFHHIPIDYWHGIVTYVANTNKKMMPELIRKTIETYRDLNQPPEKKLARITYLRCKLKETIEQVEINLILVEITRLASELIAAGILIFNQDEAIKFTDLFDGTV